MKKIISLLLIICVVTIGFTSCANFSEEDQTIAEKCAKQEAEEYYEEYFEGKTISGVSYSSCSTSVKNAEFKGGKYIITIALYAKVSNGTYYTSMPLMDIEYSITVKNEKATVVKTEYLN